ncbi:hypothetical protein ACVW00_002461 [Marmoricola sp. URHA0025 HA25]
MSDDQPTAPLETSAQVETVGPQGAARRSRRLPVVAAVAVAVAAVLGGGAYAAYSYLDGGGPQPADVLPASTIALVSVDLDPSAGQKIAAIKSIRRFPALKESLGLHADDDLREFVFDKATGSSGCKLDFDRDVKPWLGKRAAFAGVDLGGASPSPVIALQISDRAKAEAGFAAIVKCTHPEVLGYVVGDDYLIASDSVEHARRVLDDGKAKPLADDAAYRKWTGEAGDAGVLSFYVGNTSTKYLSRLLDETGGHLLGFGTGSPGAPATEEALKGFQGLGGTVRFADGGMELSIAGGGLRPLSSVSRVGAEVGDLPGDTSVALGLGVSKDYAKRLLDQLGDGADDLTSQAESAAGLDLPEDLQTLLGSAVTLSLGGDAPDSLDAIQGPEDVPIGLVVHGDADRIRAVISKIEEHTGTALSDIPLNIDDAGGKVAIGPGDYAADELLKDGHLGNQDRFRDVVPDADKAAAILYVDFDSKWRDLIVDAVTREEGPGSGEELDSNTAPLRALGISSWIDHDVTHALVKLTTD